MPREKEEDDSQSKTEEKNVMVKVVVSLINQGSI